MNQEAQFVFFGITPQLDSFYHLQVTTPSSLGHVIKCREFIFTEPLVLASPISLAYGTIDIVLPIKYYEEGRLLARLKKQSFKINKPRPVTYTVYAACFKYTLTAKMAPTWNVVGDYLVQGRNFLSDPLKKNMVKMEVNFTPGKFTIVLTPLSMTIPAISLDDLDIDYNTIKAFQDNKGFVISQYAIGNKWCHILPSNKKGQVVSVSHSLPPSRDGGFASYKDMKRYWKNTYGYRLPETDDDLFYFQVNFKLIGSKLFTYPSMCVRQAGYISQVKDRQALCESFISDIRTHMKAVCGMKVSLSRTPHTTTPQLHPVSTVNPLPSRPNSTPVSATPTNKSATPTYSTSVTSAYAKRPLVLQSTTHTVQGNNTNTAVTSVINKGDVMRGETVLTLSDNTAPGNTPAIPQFLLKQRAKAKILSNNHSTTSAKSSVTSAKYSASHAIAKSLNFSDKLPNKAACQAQVHQDNPSLQRQMLPLPRQQTAVVPATPQQVNTGTPCSSEAKRGLDIPPGVAAKKLKTAVDQTAVNSIILTLANTSCLSKASNSTLTAWLKQHEVIVKSKDKKPDLVGKVIATLKLEQ